MINLFLRFLVVFHHSHMNSSILEGLITFIISLAVTGVRLIRGKDFVHTEVLVRYSQCSQLEWNE